MNMARRKRARARVRTITRRIGRKVKRASSKPETVIIPAMAYGALREKVSMAIDPLLSKIPLGNVADEVGMGILSYILAKKTSGMVKKIATAGLTIEAARAGEALISGGFNFASSGSTGDSPLLG